MLGNNADDFFTKPMPTTVTTQATRGGAEMPAPRETARVGRAEMLPGMGEEPRAMYVTQRAEMLPGMGAADMLPGMGAADMLPGMGALDFLKNPAVLIGGAVAAWVLFSKKGRKMVGIG